MSFKATLKLGNSEFDVITCSYSFYRDVDVKGRPSSIVYGGRIDFSVESTDDTSIIETMVNNQHKPIDGTVTWTKVDADGTLKVLTFEHSFVVAYSEAFSTSGGDAMLIQFSISAETLKIGNMELVNDWPVKK
ncbi:type VI secretion system tube protein TssD [soil metagenome]